MPSPFDYSAVEVRAGATVAVVMNDLPRDLLPLDPETGEREPGEFPVAHVAQLGDVNPLWVAWHIDQADPTKSPAAPTKKKPAKKLTVDAYLEMTQEECDKRREGIAFAVKRIEARFPDGTPATDADIPAWIRALPQRSVDRIWNVAWNEANYQNRNLADPKAIAEK